MSLAQSNSSNITNDETKKINDESLALLNLGRYNDLIVLFDRALAIDPNDTEVLYDKGLALDFLGKYYEAISLFDKALAINPNDY
jgi:tetratricopeptide (TPR) repeat protein